MLQDTTRDRGRWSGSVLALILISCLASAAEAHLSIIRQGFETAGANEVGDQLGRSVAAGDFNGDGFDDLAMGAPQEDVGSASNAGAVCINFGSERGITHEGWRVYTADDLGMPLNAGANLGWSLASDDLNRDGFDDLLVGAPYDLVNGIAGAGAVHFLRGSPTGLLSWFRFDQGHFGGNVEANDNFGFSVATGHVNGDSYPDVAIGSPGEDNALGAGLWVLGTVAGPFGTTGILDLSNSGQTPRAGEMFGFSVCIGNLMSGSEDEIIFGVPNRDGDTGVQDFGAVMVTPGSASGPLPASSLYYTSPGSVDAQAKFGYSVAAGHLLSGSYDALAVGEPFRDIHPTPAAGRVCVFPGGANGLAIASFVEVRETNAGGALGADDGFGQAIAVGYFENPADGFEDLAVGTPGEGFGTANSYGQVQILRGGVNGPTGAYGWWGFNQGTLNEKVEIVDVLGSSVAFGRFDDSGFGNLAVGAPGEDSFAGMVHVIAPWRQVYGLSCERSVVLDCNDEIYFSQKPFEETLIASTTKIMTVVVACEHIEHDLDARLDDVYTVPAWVENSIPGSQVPLFEGETITLEDLLYTCLMLSGNDAAYAIADIIHGGKGPDDSVVTFINEMNWKATLIGMTHTHFNNPAGLEVEPVGPDHGEHYSTPHDMAILSAYALTSPLFRRIASMNAWSLVRHFETYDIAWTIQNGFLNTIQANIAPATGIKGGWTPAANLTGCFSAASPYGERMVATTFGTVQPVDPPNPYGPDAGALLQLGLGRCGYYFSLPSEWKTLDPIVTDAIRSGAGQRHGAGMAIPSVWDGHMEFTLFRTGWESGETSSLTMWLTHLVGLRAAPTHSIGARIIDGHGPIRITNVSEYAASFDFYLPYQVQAIQLQPGETIVIPERIESRLGFPVTFSSNGDGDLDLDVEIPYLHYVDAPAEPEAGQEEVLRTRLFCADGMEESIEVRTEGLDPVASSYALFAHVPGVAVGVPIEEDAPADGSFADGTSIVRLRNPEPNPFQHSTRIGFDLAVAAKVEVQIHDVGGRLVRAYDAADVPAGGWGVLWDGRTSEGMQSGAGIYFYQVTVNGEVAGKGRLIRVD